jgi:hypothetical protein
MTNRMLFSYASKVPYKTSRKQKDKRGIGAEEAVPYVFRTYDHWTGDTPSIRQRNFGLADDTPIWIVTRATMAIPFYFNPITIDNRIFQSDVLGLANPTEEMLNEVALLSGNDIKSIGLLLSLGTGEMQLEHFGKTSLRKYLSYINTAKKVGSRSMSTHENVQALCRTYNLPYFRFNVPAAQCRGLQGMPLFEWKVSKERSKERIAKIVESYCDQDDTRGMLRDVANALVSERRARQQFERWDLLWRCVNDSGLEAQ